MDVAVFNAHTVTECNCCGKVLVVDNSPDTYTTCGVEFREAGDVASRYRQHLEAYPDCQKWHDDLPTLADVHRLMRESTGHSNQKEDQS